MSDLNEQLEYNTYIVPNEKWDIMDFRMFHFWISKGFIIQDDNTKFMINPEWNERDMPTETEYYEEHGNFIKTEEERIECHDCGELSECFEKRQGVSMGGWVYDYSIGKCCEENYNINKKKIKFVVKK
jgi:hypothetical protein